MIDDYDQIAIPMMFTVGDGFIAMTLSECHGLFRKVRKICERYDQAIPPAPEGFSHGYLLYRLPRTETGAYTPAPDMPKITDPATNDPLDVWSSEKVYTPKPSTFPMDDATADKNPSPHDMNNLPPATDTRAILNGILINGIPTKIPAHPQRLAPRDEADQNLPPTGVTVTLTEQRLLHCVTGRGRMVVPADHAPEKIGPGSVIDASDVRTENLQIIRPIDQGDLFRT